MDTYEQALKMVMACDDASERDSKVVYLFQTNHITGETFRMIWRELGHKNVAWWRR